MDPAFHRAFSPRSLNAQAGEDANRLCVNMNATTNEADTARGHTSPGPGPGLGDLDVQASTSSAVSLVLAGGMQPQKKRKRQAVAVATGADSTPLPSDSSARRINSTEPKLESAPVANGGALALQSPVSRDGTSGGSFM